MEIVPATVKVRVRQGGTETTLPLEAMLNLQKRRSEKLNIPGDSTVIGCVVQLPNGNVTLDNINTYAAHPDPTLKDERFALTRVSARQVVLSYQGAGLAQNYKERPTPPHTLDEQA